MADPRGDLGADALEGKYKKKLGVGRENAFFGRKKCCVSMNFLSQPCRLGKMATRQGGKAAVGV